MSHHGCLTRQLCINDASHILIKWFVQPWCPKKLKMMFKLCFRKNYFLYKFCDLTFGKKEVTSFGFFLGKQ